MVYTLDMFFRQRWKDERLRHSLTDNLTLIMGTKHPSDIIWVPDTVFIDSVASKMHSVTVNNHKIDINHDGSVFWGTRVTVSPSCPLNLKAYPMDSQECPFEIVSYAYTSRHVVYRWKDRGMIISPKLPMMAQFLLKSFKTSRKEISYVAGNYTVLAGHFHFKRLMGFAVMQIYIPTICVVIVSWISLWVKRSAVPARIALLITTLLTISTVWSSINAQLPRVNYVKAIDIFMMASYVSIIMTLLEFTVVINTHFVLRALRKNAYGRSRTVPLQEVEDDGGFFKKNLIIMGEKKSGDNLSLIGGGGKENLLHAKSQRLVGGYNGVSLRCRSYVNSVKGVDVESASSDSSAKEEEESDRLAESIESCARIVFPLIYLTFLLCYFPIFLVEDNKDGHGN